VVPLEDCITATDRRLDSDAEAILEIISRFTEWRGLKDAGLPITGTATRTDRGTEDASLSIKLGSLWATFDVARSWVGCGDNIVKGVL
jgi:hypothetical protein